MSIYILSAPSGAGKTTVSNEFLSKVNTIKRVITVTTRKPREGEENNKDYIFISKESFLKKIQEGAFLEYAEVYGNLYGTPKDQVESNESQGIDSLLVIDVQGARSIRNIYTDCISIFLLPPSIEALLDRMKKRGSEDENLELRIKKVKEEICALSEFDYVIVNDNIKTCVEELITIYKASKLTTKEFLKNPRVVDPQMMSIFKA
ncbi:MAG: guanylate kinase [Aquificaceae bacterium]|nr:guanylate kinase [Aquificaceae bacterium]MDW8237537.1 guanylate kinase [Aquificaceae bacterium]